MNTSTPAKPSSVLLPPRILKLSESSLNGIECSIHTHPKALEREFRHVFGDEYLKRPLHSSDSSQKSLELIAIPTNQHATEDLVAIGDHIEKEKDRLLNVFIEFASEICQRLNAKGYWADFIDPCSGLPMISLNRNKVYSEVDGMEILLNYKAYNAGFCKILTHPKWGSAVYPATIFAHCPVDVAKEVMQSYPDFENSAVKIECEY